LAILTTESSYAQELEQAATAVPDTLQFWLAPESQWRIRTDAVDHDVHVYDVSPRADGSRLTVEPVKDHITKPYDDVTAKVVILSFREPGD
jgi:hypothetical protein